MRPILFLLALTAPAHAPSEGDALAEALDAAARRAQARMEAKLELWEDHSTWDKAWVVRSEHYEVKTTNGRYLAASTAEELEVMLGLFRETLMVDPAWQPNETLRVAIHPEIEAYNAFGQPNGAEHSSFYGSFYSPAAPERPVATYFVPNRQLLRMWITHGAFHQFLDRVRPQGLSPALTEALASYFALCWDFSYGVGVLGRMKASGRLFPLRELLRASEGEFADRTEERFVELGMLVAYLVHHRADTRTVKKGGEVWQAPFSEYLDALLTGDDAELHPVHELLNGRVGELEKDFFAFEFPRG